MIKGFWNEVEIVCGCHENKINMEINNGPSSMFYSCPKYYPENRNSTERACANRISLVDYERMLNYLQDLIMTADDKNEVINLKGYEWTTNKNINFNVIEHSKGKIIVKMTNKKALK